jgi:hypothetical protein
MQRRCAKKFPFPGNNFGVGNVAVAAANLSAGFDHDWFRNLLPLLQMPL